MQIRYRILKPHFDPELNRVSRQADARREPIPGLNGWAVNETAPQAISAVEGTASEEQLRQLIAGGDLKLRDLVNVGNGWEPLEDCLPLDEITAPYRRRAAHLKMLVRVGIGALLLFIFAALLLYT
jgi:hypothetical protein